MRDIRLEEMPFEFDGKTFLLCCNMNVLADVQDAFDGQISGALSGESPTKSVLAFLTAMLNDYAEGQGWPERYSMREVGRRLTPAMTPSAAIMGLVSRAVAPPNPDAAPDVSDPDAREPDSPGN